ncbi:MAG: Tfp pilus assembly protein FimT/FimU [Microcystaceae cyanobacterium]
MVHVHAIRKDQGFTLIEILTALIIAGMLAAISLPSLLSLLKSNELKGAQDQVISALRDAQIQAIRRGKKCTIVLDPISNPVTILPKERNDAINPNDLGCLSAGQVELPKDITVVSNGINNEFVYSFKGHTHNFKTLTLSSNGTNKVRCIVISTYLGIIRSGIYSGDDPTAPVAAKCQTTTS